MESVSSPHSVPPLPAEHLRLVVDNDPREQLLDWQYDFSPVERPTVSLNMIAAALVVSALIWAALVIALAMVPR